MTINEFLNELGNMHVEDMYIVLITIVIMIAIAPVLYAILSVGINAIFKGIEKLWNKLA